MRGLSKLIGLATEKERARIDIVACKQLGETFPHTILYGRGGTGKTAFARAIAEELNAFFVEREAASLVSRDNIVELLINAQAEAAGKPLLLFLDECQRLTERRQEVLYFPMVEWRIDKGNEKDGTLNTFVSLSPFTLVAATTQIWKLDEHSFVGRFANKWELAPYADVFMSQIVTLLIESHRMKYSPAVVNLIVSLCRGIPRTAGRLVIKVRNHALAHERREMQEFDVRRVLELNGSIDDL